MARLATYASTYVNGVAELHTEILKADVLKEWYQVYPERFQNKTNGITQRRWLGLCNPELSALITEKVGSDAWLQTFHFLKSSMTALTQEQSQSSTTSREEETAARRLHQEDGRLRCKSRFNL